MKHTYMVYTREDSGEVRRTHKTVQLNDEEREHYTNREELMGWPESLVYWARPCGASTGIAPPIGRAARRKA